MADFLYSQGIVPVDKTKFERLYDSHMPVSDDTELFYNKPVVHIVKGCNSLSLLGTAVALTGETESYLENLLEHYDECELGRVKKELVGQWIMIVRHDGNMYVLSDFLQIRSVYYSPEDGLVSSSFAPLHTALGGTADSYKCFEYLMMRHCLYPVWLGNTTLNSRVYSLQGFEYLKIDLAHGTIEVKSLTYTIDNAKVDSLDEISGRLKSRIEKIMYRPEYKDQPVTSTITGGFDSRLITTFADKFYTDLRLRVSVFGNKKTVDSEIAHIVAKAMSCPLDVYVTDKDKKEMFYLMTDCLSPQENSIITDLVLHNGSCELGFGGVMGTEIFMSLPFDTIEKMITTYSGRVVNHMNASDDFRKRFETALQDTFADIKAHYLFSADNPSDVTEKDYIRLFMAFVTARFSSALVSSFDVYGRQVEPLATFSVLETALQIPYYYMGDKSTFGRFYLVPKNVVMKQNKRVSLLRTNHFTPMHPLTPLTFIPYFIGKLKKRRHFARMIKQRLNEVKNIKIETPDWSYAAADWPEGFVDRYLSEYKK